MHPRSISGQGVNSRTQHRHGHAPEYVSSSVCEALWHIDMNVPPGFGAPAQSLNATGLPAGRALGNPQQLGCSAQPSSGSSTLVLRHGGSWHLVRAQHQHEQLQGALSDCIAARLQQARNVWPCTLGAAVCEASH